jgi:hypothetical protein
VAKTSTSFQLGNKAAKGKRGPGRPKGSVRHVKELARAYTQDAVLELASVMKDHKKSPPGVRVAAANSLLDRGWGKPVTPFERRDRTVLDEIAEMTDEELDASIRATLDRLSGGSATTPFGQAPVTREGEAPRTSRRRTKPLPIHPGGVADPGAGSEAALELAPGCGVRVSTGVSPGPNQEVGP